MGTMLKAFKALASASDLEELAVREKARRACREDICGRGGAR